MLKERIHRLIVVGEEARIEGIVTHTDVLRAVAQGAVPLRAPDPWPFLHADPAEAIPSMGER